MRHLFKCFTIIFLLSGSLSLSGQDVPLGSWKDYLSYRNGVTVTMGKNAQKQTVVYCVAGSGLFSFNTGDNSIEKLSKVTGLSDVSPSVARLNNYDGVLVIGYTDGNIDILNNNSITNIPDLKNSNVQGTKGINCVYFSNNYAYVGCGQGIMQIDLTQDVILNTFYFGTSGAALNVRGVTISNDTIFAATDNGIYLASLNDPNINNYNDWHQVPNTMVPTGKYNTIATVGDSVFANWSYNLSKSPASGYDTTYVYYNGLWKSCINNVGLYGNAIVYSLESSTVNNENYLVASSNFFFRSYGSTGAFEINGQYIISGNTVYPQAQDAILDASGNAWVADNAYGLVYVGKYNISIPYTPSGPYNNLVFNMAVNNNNLWVLPGEYDANFSPTYLSYGISAIQNDTWTYIPQPSGEYDLNCIAIDPANPLHYFAGSFGAGLVEFKNNAVVNIWNASNSGLQAIVPGYPTSTSCRTAGLAYDTIGNLWVTNCLAVSDYLSVEKPDQTWKAFNFASISGISQANVVTNVIITQSQAKWILFNGTGILAFQDNGTYVDPSPSNAHLITNTVGNGGLPDLDVTCMAVDQNGSIWIGTDEQVVVFYSPDNVFDGNHDWDAQPVYVTQNGYTQYLMQNQVTTAIAVDGANRKWIGTQGGGVFLMSADGTQQIYNFTTSNSPLISNNIQSIVINPNNGEVFFGTDKGIVSFKGDATQGLTQFNNVYAYPDPVPHGYTGPVAIKNLVTNADVKITTINGELVYHTTALGGQAIWNGDNFDGKRVQTGVYLVFCASPDGTQTLVSKLLFIN